MSYVVLARKYRPQRFDDMVGQEHVGRTLGNAIKHDRVHHAYLFAGARGLGKTTTARIFAKGLVCERGPTPEPCNECEQCVAVGESRSVDVVEIDGASNNSVDNIRNLREQVHYLPQSARRKVYIIDEVHMLTTSAFNALLKTLEEPPAHVNFVFATTEPQKVLPTILSRVSRLDFRRVSVPELTAYLRSILDREGLEVDDGGLRIIARAGGGSVRDSLTLLDQVVAFADDPKAVQEAEVRKVLGQADAGAIGDLVGAVLRRDPDAVVATLDELVTSGHDLAVLSMQTLEHLRDLMLIKVCKTPDVLPDATQSERESLRAAVADVDAMTIGQTFDRFSRVVERLPTSRVPRLLIEMGLLDLAYSEPVVPLGDLVERLQALSGGRAVPSGSGGGSPSFGGGGPPRGGPPPGRSRQGFDASPPSGPPAQAPRSDFGPARATASTSAPAPAPTPAPEPAETPPSSEGSNPSPATSNGAPPPSNGHAPASRPDFGGSSVASQLWQKLEAEGMLRREPEPPPPTPSGPSGPPDDPGPWGNASSPSSSQSPPAEPKPGTGAPSPVCGDCVEPGPSAGAIDLDALPQFDAWEALLGRMRKEAPETWAVLAQVGLQGIDDQGVIRVAAPKSSFAYMKLSDPGDATRAVLEQATRDHFGRPYTVKLEEGEPTLPDLPSVVLVHAERKAQHRAQIESEARSDPRLGKVLSEFGGKLAMIKPLQDPT